MADRIKGGLAAGMSPFDFDPVQLHKGTKVEMEHTNDPLIAREIAMDHLVEDDDYYKKLAKMEGHEPNPDRRDLWTAAQVAGSAASAYHGYKRNEVSGNPIAWSVWWGIWGAIVPIITVPIAIAQGFGKQR